ncbi:Flp pilus assembly complex ATPase component TadA [Candidatus Kuenenbacteria bacterium]|nr:Flp pilus assembly complex ATPase component TadA [Candidatus Kuenenbacteria bacterium]
MINETEFAKDLEKAKVLSSGEINKYIKEAQAKKISLADLLIGDKVIDEKQAFEKIAKAKGVPFIDLSNEVIRRDILQFIPEPIAQSHGVVAFDKKGANLRIATLDPTDLQTFAFIEKKIEMPLEIYYTTPTSITNVLKQYHRSLRAEFEKITGREASEGEEKEKLKEMAEDLPIVRVVDTLLEYAIFEGASDIHIEPIDKEVIIRYRIDGVLREVMTLPKKVHLGLVARIKILSNLKLDEHRLPQDGRFKIETDDYKISFRVSIIPVFDGEKIVMRLLNESNRVLTLEQLGFQDKALAAIKRNIEKPNGMVLVTGPTGSGKTTTLYTILNLLNKPGVNITTIEDPIEYRMPGVNQSQVNPKIGYTFAAGLRAFLRQDPNIIMVGEIRDTETADIAVNAAMTGHLVLATLHTNDAATALPRLQDMNIASFLIASTVNIIVAQRLVRRVCSNCIQKYKLDKNIIKELEQYFDLDNIMGVFKKNNLLKTAKSWDSLEFYKGKGCNQCKEGYKGRMGIYEVLEVTPEIGDMVLKNSSSEVILKKAREQGMITMTEDGFIKAKNGITTIEEIIRVTKE